MKGKKGMRKLYYFETLPIRLQPMPLESLTSYLTRLAEANGIRYTSAFSTLISEDPNPMRQLVDLIDFPLLSFEAMPKVMGLSQPRLLALTFYHLARKFGRSIDALRKDHFLLGATAAHLRYCPHCLKESAHYSLTWRFSTLPGCAMHACRFLERCGYCGDQLPLLVSPFKMAFCPACGRDLRACSTEPLTEEERRITLRRGSDLQFLLSLQACENDTLLPQKIGGNLRYWRRAHGLSTQDVASRLGVAVGEIFGAERGTVKKPSARFYTYIRYAELFNLPLRHLFPPGR